MAGAGDSRLGKIDIVLVSHMHGDHVGNAHNKALNSGSCENPDMSVSAMPNSNAVNIALAKKSKIVTGSEMPPFFAAKLNANGGNPTDSMMARFGSIVVIGGVRIATVTALHSNGVDPDYIGGELGRAMNDASIAGDVVLAPAMYFDSATVWSPTCRVTSASWPTGNAWCGTTTKRSWW